MITVATDCTAECPFYRPKGIFHGTGYLCRLTFTTKHRQRVTTTPLPHLDWPLTCMHVHPMKSYFSLRVLVTLQLSMSPSIRLRYPSCSVCSSNIIIAVSELMPSLSTNAAMGQHRGFSYIRHDQILSQERGIN